MTAPLPALSRLPVVVGALPGLIFLGGLVAVAAMIRLTAFALSASLAGSLFVWAKASRTIRRHQTVN
jgi:hypothetical protein